MARARAVYCAVILAASAFAACDDRRSVGRSDAGTDAGGTPAGASCASDLDCLDGVCRVSAVTGERNCYANCPSDQINHLCADGSQCFGYCRGDQGPNPLGARCASTETCLPGLECADGTCTRVCDVDHLEICEPGTTCELFPDGWGLCRQP